MNQKCNQSIRLKLFHIHYGICGAVQKHPLEMKSIPYGGKRSRNGENFKQYLKSILMIWCGVKRKMKGALEKTRRVSPSGINILNSFFIKPFIIVLKPINIRTWNQIKLMGKSSINRQFMGWIIYDDTWQSICYVQAFRATLFRGYATRNKIKAIPFKRHSLRTLTPISASATNEIHVPPSPSHVPCPRGNWENMGN